MRRTNGGRRIVTRAAVDACEPRRLLASVSGTVFFDENRNGVREAAEPAGTFAVFVDSNGSGFHEAGELIDFADANGRYRIDGIPADGRDRRLVADTGTAFVSPAAGRYTINFTSNTEATGRDFALVPPASFQLQYQPVFDVIPNDNYDAGDASATLVEGWVDLDRDGVRDAAEPALRSVPPAPTPGSLGFNTFVADVSANQPYRVVARFTDPAGRLYVRTVDYPKTNYSTAVNAPLLYYPGGTVTGTVYNDANRNGTRDAGENGVFGAFVFADLDGDGAKDPTERAGGTDADGFFSILDIPPQAAPITIRPYALGPDTSITDPSAGYRPLTMSSVRTAAGFNFGIAGPGASPSVTITGTVFDDANADGTRDAAEAGLAGKVAYADIDRDGVRDAGETFALTNASGFYSLANIPWQTSSIIVRLDGVPTSRITAPANGYHTGLFDRFIVAPNRNFGVRPAAPAATIAVAGRAFVDRDGNGVFSAGDVSNVGRVFADLNRNGASDAGEPSTTRAADGTFRLPGVPAGASVAIVAADLEPDVRVSREVTTPATGELGGLQIYLTHPASATIRGRVFSDVNGNGVFDAGDSTIRGQAVYVDLNYNGTFFDEPVGYSDENGFYAIVDVPPSNASAAVRLLRVPTAQVTTPAGGAHSGKFSAAITYANRDFGIRPSAGISGVVFNDVDADGILDASEPFIGGLTVYADLDGDGLFDTDEPHGFTATFTGFYSFTGIPVRPAVSVQVRLAGISSYRVTQPAGGSHSAKFDGAYTRGGVIFGVAPD